MLQNLTWTDLRACVAQRWSPEIGDPNLTGWLTVLAYAVCAILAAWVVARAHPGRERKFWVVVTLIMAFLAVNKQLDLQSALTATGRCISQFQGWYDERRSFQRHFIQGLLAIAILGLALSLYLMRRNLRRNALALLGLGIVTAFVAVRAVGFHHFDVVLNASVMDLRYNFIFEVSGLVLIAVNALHNLVRPRRRRSHRL